jgi:hypothetical protein
MQAEHGKRLRNTCIPDEYKTKTKSPRAIFAIEDAVESEIGWPVSRNPKASGVPTLRERGPLVVFAGLFFGQNPCVFSGSFGWVERINASFCAFSPLPTSPEPLCAQGLAFLPGSAEQFVPCRLLGHPIVQGRRRWDFLFPSSSSSRRRIGYAKTKSIDHPFSCRCLLPSFYIFLLTILDRFSILDLSRY